MLHYHFMKELLRRISTQSHLINVILKSVTITLHLIFDFEGDVINKYYYPILIPIGIIGNILSILVSNFL